MPGEVGSSNASLIRKSTGLFFQGRVSAKPGADQFTIPALAGLGAGKFADAVAPWWAVVLRSHGGTGVAPQGEMHLITAYNSATGMFTAPGFSAAVDAGDDMQIISSLLAIQALKETGGSVTTDGNEQIVYQNDAPVATWSPRCVKIDFTAHTATESITVKTYYRIVSAGGYILQDSVSWTLSVPLEPLVNIGLEPNRWGIKVTIQKTAGTNRAYPWEALYEEV
jgi:hypothetical protein